MFLEETRLPTIYHLRRNLSLMNYDSHRNGLFLLFPLF